jgi:uncharacterized glyoxalase superfamily protein PhnB
MKHNRSVPPATVTPVLAYPDVPKAVAWLAGAFGFAERVRIGDSHRSQMSIGSDGAVIVCDSRGAQQPPPEGAYDHVIKVRVEDVDAQFRRAKEFGAKVLREPTDREYGERDCLFEDLAGHRWEFSQTMHDVAPEEFGCKTVEAWPAP